MLRREKERVIKPNKSEGPFLRPGLLMRPAPTNAIPASRRPHKLQVERQMKENEKELSTKDSVYMDVI